MELQLTNQFFLTSSEVGESVQGLIGVTNNTTSNITVDVFWCMGTWDGVSNFGVRAYVLEEGITFTGQTSWMHKTYAFYTPDEVGTWDLMAILADNVEWEGDNLKVEGQRGTFMEEDAWTITGAVTPPPEDLEITSLGVEVV